MRAEDVVPRGELPTSYAGRCRRTMFDHYRAHGFTGSPRVLTAPEIAARLGALAGRPVEAVDDPPAGPVPPASDWAGHCRRLMLDHYREHGFNGSPRVLEGLLGRPARRIDETLRHLVGAR